MGFREIFFDSKSQLTSSAALDVDIFVPSMRAVFVQLRVMLAGAFTGDVTVTIDKVTGSNYDQEIVSEALSGVDNAYVTNINLYAQAGDILKIETSGNAPDGTQYVELGFLSSGT